MNKHRILLKSRLVLRKEEKILLMHQTSDNGGKYTLPGGTVEDNEFAKLSLVRELLEETGILVDFDSLELIHVLHKKKANKTRVILYFGTDKWLGKPISKESKKFKDVGWYGLKDLPKPLSPTVKHILSEYKKGRVYSEFAK